MSLHTKVLSLVDVLLRVPPLFVIDELFRIGLGLPQDITKEYYFATAPNNSTESLVLQEGETENILPYNPVFYKFIFLVLIKFILSCIGCMASLCVFILWTKHLLVVYMYLISVGVVFASYWGNVATIRVLQDCGYSTLICDLFSFKIVESQCLQALVCNYIGQLLASVTFLYTYLGAKTSTMQNICPLNFLAPSLLAFLPLPRSLLTHAPALAAILPLAMLKFILWINLIPVMRTLYTGYLHVKTFVSDIGFMAMMETEWLRLKVPSVLRIFWVLRLMGHAGALQWDDMSAPALLIAAKTLLTSGCETVTAVLGMTSVISFICHYIGSLFLWILLTEDEEDKSIGTVSAVLFYILALQTGLTGLDPEKRFIRLCRNFCLLFTALLHFIHNIVNPLLMSLSASHNPSLHRHLRALSVCAFLIIYSVSLLAYLWSHHQMSTWLLAVSAFTVEVIIKVIVSLLIYTLFLIDACRTTFWEKLDDYVYYIRAFGNTVEFCFGIFLFFNGAWILFFESGGAIRAGMMGIHAYFNIWCEARAGWSVFMKRRTAVNKIESLPEASGSQLASLDDVCAICYQEMQSAKITRCNHFFHGVCLRKWLYVQDRCPLCHDILYRVEAIESEKEGGGNPPDAGGTQVPPQNQVPLLDR